MKTAAVFMAIIIVAIGGFVLFGKSQNGGETTFETSPSEEEIHQREMTR